MRGVRSLSPAEKARARQSAVEEFAKMTHANWLTEHKGELKVLIAVFCCHKYRAWEQTIRDTWAKDSSVDVKFFLGNPVETVPAIDEVFVNADDTQAGRTNKLVEVYRWALAHGYDYVFRCDPDTFVRPALLLDCGFERHDYMGALNSVFASGGSGFWLSKRAMQIVTTEPIAPDSADDVYVADRLRPHGIVVYDDKRFKYYPGDVLDDQTVAYHLSSVKGWNAGATCEDIHRAYNGTFRLNDGVSIEAALKTEGWMDAPDLTFLAEQAKKHTGIAEIGSWMGRSTRALADNTIGIVHCVDTWKGSGLEHDPWLKGKSPEWLFEQFSNNTRGCNNLRIFRMTSLEGAQRLKDMNQTLDMIFIDASHDYENVKADILAWKPLLKPGGMFCGHDYQDCWPEVIKAVHELLTGVKVVPGGSIWYTEE
jgi:hypothetical protein